MARIKNTMKVIREVKLIKTMRCLLQILYISIMQVQMYMKPLTMRFALDTHKVKGQKKPKEYN